jgi:hypothetical protein
MRRSRRRRGIALQATVVTTSSDDIRFARHDVGDAAVLGGIRRSDRRTEDDRAMAGISPAEGLTP